MADPCTLVTTGIYTRMADATIGFNAAYDAIQGTFQDFGGDYVDPIVIDWTRNSSNFTLGLVPVDLIEESSPFTYPLVTISADVARSYGPGNQKRIHYQRFSGMVIGTIQAHLSWRDVAVRDFETWPNAVVSAMFATMNAPSISAPTVPNSWGTGVTYGYDLSAVKGPIVMAGQNWRRTITFSGTFEVTIS
jgi:hypothetical protein